MVDQPEFLMPAENQSLENQTLPTPEADLYLRFLISSRDEFALPAAEIREVLSPSPDQITSVPNTASYFLGLLNLRGRVIWVVDVGRWLHTALVEPHEVLPLNPNRPELSVIAIEGQELLVGLAVEHVLGMEWLELRKLQPIDPTPALHQGLLQGQWLEPVSQRRLCLLNTEALLQSLNSAPATRT
jgi:purine-binding chemotaxis protein CheW